MSTCKYCENCKNVAMLSKDTKEKYSYYIGDHEIQVLAYVMKKECPRCGAYWEEDNAREIRNEAFKKYINNFWDDLLKEDFKQSEISNMKFIVARTMMKLGYDKKRQVASELGRWLADCAFLC